MTEIKTIEGGQIDALLRKANIKKKYMLYPRWGVSQWEALT